MEFSFKLPQSKILTHQELTFLRDKFKNWCKEFTESRDNLPTKGRIYGALVVCENFLSANESEPWGYANSENASSTHPSNHFGDRAIKNHTNRRVKIALERWGKTYLYPGDSGEAGRTSSGTKIAGLRIIQLVTKITKSAGNRDIKKVGDETVKVICYWILQLLDEHAKLGGIEVDYKPNETILRFIEKIIESATSNSGAVLQHLVGAKLEIRYKNDVDVKIEHHNASTADIQTGRYGDFDIGTSVIHVTMVPNLGHFEKALKNAKSGRTTYILIPRKMKGLVAHGNNLDANYQNKVNVISIEQFISQNINELAKFNRRNALRKLHELLETYNFLIETYEKTNSLKIVIPDFGL